MRPQGTSRRRTSRNASTSARDSFPQPSTGLHRVSARILLTPHTGTLIFRVRLNRKLRELNGSNQTSRFLNRFRDSEGNREVQRPHGSASTQRELNGDCGVTLNRGDSEKLGCSSEPQWLNSPCSTGSIRTLRGFRVWLKVRKGLTASAIAGPNQEARRLHASVWRTRLAARLLGRRIDSGTL